jgi:flagellar basal body-associated protein FliL
VSEHPHPEAESAPEGTQEKETTELPEPDSVSDAEGPKPTLKELLHASDSPSKYLTILSMVFAGLALICSGILVVQYLKYRSNAKNEAARKEEEAKLYGGWLAGQHKFKYKSENGDDLVTQPLGEFRASWKNIELRVDLVAECSDEETCKSLKDQELKVRDLLMPLIQGSSQEEVMNPTRKLAFRRRLAEKLNELELKGRVIQIDFTDMTLEPNARGN